MYAAAAYLLRFDARCFDAHDGGGARCLRDGWGQAAAAAASAQAGCGSGLLLYDQADLRHGAERRRRRRKTNAFFFFAMPFS